MKPRPLHFLPVAAWLLGAPLAGMGCSSAAAPPGARTRPPPLVGVTKAEARDVPVEIHAPVDLRPLASADVGAKTLGYLDAVLADRGDKVRKGQILALVRPSDLPDQLAAARGTLASAQAGAALARTSFDRAKALAPTAVVSQQELQQAQGGLAAAEAAEEGARAQIAALAVRLGETRIESPLSGVVAQRRLDPGTLVGPTAGTGAIMTVVRVDTLRVFVTINEHDLRGVGVGNTAHVEVDALPGRRFGGKVVRLAPTFDPTTRTLEAEVQIDNSSGELRPGMCGRGSILIETHPGAVVVPATAIQFNDKQAYVFVVQGDTAARRELTLGVDGGNWLEVKHGLAAGEEVVTAGAEGLSNGAKVRASRGVDPYTGAKADASPAGKPGATGTAHN